MSLLNTLPPRFALARLAFVLWLFLSLPFGMRIIATPLTADFLQNPYCCLTGLPILLALFIAAADSARIRPWVTRALIAVWLVLFLLGGFDDFFQYTYEISDWPWQWYPWIGYYLYGLVIGVPLLVIALKRVAELGIIKLTVYMGFLITFSLYQIDLLNGQGWFGMYVRLGIGMFGGPEGFDWIEAIGTWTHNLDWLGYRLFTYAGLGYLVAKRTRVISGFLICMLVALIDSTLSWLVFLPDDGDFEAESLLLVLQYEWPVVLRAIVIQVVYLTLFSVGGLIATRTGWRWRSKRSVVYVPAAESTRRRPAHRVSLSNS